MLRRSDTVFEAIAHPVRRELLESLLHSRKPLSVTALGELCEISRSTASRHLDILRDAGVVVVTRGPGLTLHHDLNRRAFDTIDEWLWPFLDVER